MNTKGKNENEWERATERPFAGAPRLQLPGLVGRWVPGLKDGVLSQPGPFHEGLFLRRSAAKERFAPGAGI